jgi:DeoR family glycerol-3-phosphate regulon repressor
MAAMPKGADLDDAQAEAPDAQPDAAPVVRLR